MDDTTSNGYTTTLLTLFETTQIPLPVLPYGGSSGWSGSETSKDRAEQMDKTGSTKSNQSKTLDLLNNAGRSGLTWHELSMLTDWHHGTASGCLSVLHKTNQVARLTIRRGRSSVYVSTHHIYDRETEQHKPNVSSRLLLDILTELETDLEQNNYTVALAKVKATIKSMT